MTVRDRARSFRPAGSSRGKASMTTGITVTPKEALSLAIQHQQAGRLDDAERLYRQMISLDPSNPDVLNLLGLSMLKRKKRQEAANLFRQAVALRPEIVEYQVNLARALREKPQLKEAEAALRRPSSSNRRWPVHGRAWAPFCRDRRGLPKRSSATGAPWSSTPTTPTRTPTSACRSSIWGNTRNPSRSTAPP